MSSQFDSTSTLRTPCTFRLEGVKAAAIALVGSFNEWSTTRHLMRYFEGKWETQVSLPPGRHSYGFFVMENGEIPRGTIVQIGSTIDVSEPESQILPDIA